MKTVTYDPLDPFSLPVDKGGLIEDEYLSCYIVPLSNGWSLSFDFAVNDEDEERGWTYVWRNWITPKALLEHGQAVKDVVEVWGIPRVGEVIHTPDGLQNIMEVIYYPEKKNVEIVTR